jgi:cell division protease FtsH
MSAFDKVIGYETVKEELKQVCDRLCNANVYDELGAKMPKGLLLYGNPGVGKSLMANCLIEECGRKSYIIRRNKPDGDFVNDIKKVFEEAAKNAPSVILLEDMDKFAAEANSREEYVAIQACIDEVHSLDVYIIATVNELRDLPRSLSRAGRFDRKIEVFPPKGEDAVKIVHHYMDSKSFIDNINIEDISKMLSGQSCAELETVLNEAALSAGYRREKYISMEDVINAVLKNVYGVGESNDKLNGAEIAQMALHEAGHAVVLEALMPGSVGLVSIRTKERGSDVNGFVVSCKDCNQFDDLIPVRLAGKAAVELEYGIAGRGVSDDLSKAVYEINEYITEEGRCGMGAIDLDKYSRNPVILRTAQDAIGHAELERYMIKTKGILFQNWGFVKAVAKALIEKETLLSSDVCLLKKGL